MARPYVPKPGTFAERAVAALRDAGAALTTPELARRIGVATDQVVCIVGAAVRHGLVVADRPGHGGRGVLTTWRYVPPVAVAPAPPAQDLEDERIDPPIVQRIVPAHEAPPIARRVEWWGGLAA